jgi:hypothetical protein
MEIIVTELDDELRALNDAIRAAVRQRSVPQPVKTWERPARFEGSLDGGARIPPPTPRNYSAEMNALIRRAPIYGEAGIVGHYDRATGRMEIH